MSHRRPILAAAMLLLTATIVFSPSLAALFGSAAGDVRWRDAFTGTADAMGRSAGMAIVAAILSLVIAAPFALLVERCGRRLKAVLRAIGILVLIVPPYIVAEASVVLLGPAGRISRPMAMLLGFGPGGSDAITRARYTVPPFVHTWPMAGVVMGGCLFPIVALAIGSAYRRTDQRLFEAARLMRGRRGVIGVSIRVFAGPAIGAAILVLAVSLTEFAVPELLRVRTIGETVYEQIQGGNLAAAAAVALPTVPVVLIAAVLGVAILAKSRSASMAGLEGDVPRYGRPAMGPIGRAVAVAVTLIAIAPAIGLPAVSLTWLAVSAGRPAESALGTHKLLRASGFGRSMAGAWDLVHDDAARTMLLASVGATIATVLAFGIARVCGKGRAASSLGGFAASLAVPAPIVGLGLIVLWNRPAGQAVYGSVAVVLLAWLARFLAVTMFLVRSALARVPVELEEAAALSGRGPAARLVSVVARSAMPGLLAGWLAMYVLSATEFGATTLISPAGSPMLAPSIVNLMRRGSDPEIAACQVLLLAVVALPVLIGFLFWFLLPVFWERVRVRAVSGSPDVQ